MFDNSQGNPQANYSKNPAQGVQSNSLSWRPDDIILDLYEVRSVTEGFGESAVEKDFHQGGFGQVYRVYHRGWNQELAMKASLPGVFENEGQVADFVRECETWVELGLHPHIVTCYYVRELNGQPLAFAEYLKGGSLKDWIDFGLLYECGHGAALKRILDIAIQTARGLLYAHEKGLVHQDVKPANIMLTPDGHAKVSDFGTARARARIAANTATAGPGTILVSRGGMTPAYCSPEQSFGEKLTRRTDIWSWGLTVLEMFTGEVTWASGVAAAQALDAYLKHGSDAEEIPMMPRDMALLIESCFSSESERLANFDKVIAELVKIYQKYCGTDYPRKEPKAADDYIGSLNNRALSMHDLGRMEEAEEFWRKALQHDPTHLASTFNFGLMEWRSDKIDDYALIRKIEELRKGQPSAKSAYLLAMVHAERVDYQSAIVLLEEAASQGRDNYIIKKMLKKLYSFEDKGAGCLRSFKGHVEGVSSVYLSSERRYALSSGGGDKTFKLWEVDSGKCLRTFKGHADGVNSVCLSADNLYALSGGWDETLKLWVVENGKCLRTFEGHTSHVKAVCLSADSHYALSGSADETIMLWETGCGKCLRILESHTSAVNSVCLSVDSRYALSGSDDETLKLWDLHNGECLRTFEGHTHWVDCAYLSLDGRYAISGSSFRDKTLKLWDVYSGECLRTFEGHTSAVTSVCLSADNLYALSGSWDGTLKLWETRSGKCLRTFDGHKDYVESVCLSTDNHFALSGSRDNTLKLWLIPWTEIENRRFAAQLETSPAVQTKDVLSAEQNFNDNIATAHNALLSGDNKQAFLTLRTARLLPGRMYDRRLLDLWAKLYPHYRKSSFIDGWCLRAIEGHSSFVDAVCLSSDCCFALSGSRDKTFKLWELKSGDCLRTFDGHNYGVTSICLSNDNRYALSGSTGPYLGVPHLGEKSFNLWDVQSGERLLTFEGHTSTVTSVCLSADNRYALSGSGFQDNTVKLWDVQGGECLRTFEGHTSAIASVCLSADNRYALSGSRDGKLKLWDTHSGECIYTFKGHSEYVESVFLSADGFYALSGSKDGTLKLWNAKIGNCLRTFEGHTGVVNSICMCFDNRYILSGSSDCTLKLWDVQSGECLRTFEGHSYWVTSVCLSADNRYALSGSGDNTLRLWELYWDLESNETL